MTSMQEQIEKRLRENFDPCDLKVVNESALHQGHAGDDGSGESHFQVIIKSEKFNDISAIARHKLVYDALHQEMKTIHALSIKFF